MNIISFIKKNELWYVDMPEFSEIHLTYKEPTFISERNMIELLDTLAKKKLTKIDLEFHYDYINPYDAKLVKYFNSYKCSGTSSGFNQWIKINLSTKCLYFSTTGIVIENLLKELSAK